MYRRLLCLLILAAMAVPREAEARNKREARVDRLWMQHLEGCWKLAPTPETGPETPKLPGDAFCCTITRKRGKHINARLRVTGPGAPQYYETRVRKGRLILKATGSAEKVSYTFQLSLDPSQIRMPWPDKVRDRRILDILNFTPSAMTLRPVPGEGTDATRTSLTYVRQN